MYRMKRRDKFLRKQVQDLHALQQDKQNATDLEGLLENYNKTRNIIFRFAWLVIGIFCILICVYQIYDRIDYYVSTPTRTDIETKNVPIPMPTFSIHGIATELMKPYWSLLKDKNHYRYRYLTSIATIAFGIGQNTINLTEFWSTSNAITNLHRLRLIHDKRVLTDIQFNFPVTSNLFNKSIIKLSAKNTHRGSATLIDLREKIVFGTALVIDLRREGLHNISMVLVSFGSLLAKSDALSLYSYTNVTIRYEIEKYNFLNTKRSPCLSNVLIQEQCFDDCFAKLFNNLSCWLPFMPKKMNLIDCSTLKNVTIARDVYDSAEHILDATPISFCSCNKLCAMTFQHFSMTNKASTIDNLFTIQYQNKQTTMIEKNEKFAYDIISLLVDIGGILGLLLGLSALSICRCLQLNLMYINKTLRSKNNENHYQEIITNEFKELSRRLDNRKNQKWTTYCKAFSVSFLILASFIMIYLRVEYHSTDPTNVVISLIENQTIHLPNLVACCQSYPFVKVIQRVANFLNTSECRVDFLDLIDMANKMENVHIPEPVVLSLWNMPTCDLVQSQGQTFREFVWTHHGLCDQVSSTPITHYKYRDRTKKINTVSSNFEDCKDKSFHLYLVPVGKDFYSVIRNQLDVAPGYVHTFSIDQYVATRHNSPTRPCTNVQHFENCKLRCFHAKMLKLINCKLPFMTKINTYLCNTTATAKEALSTYISIILRTDIAKDCKCLKSCVENFYTIRTEYFSEHPIASNNTLLTIRTTNNIVESITELPMYNTVSLLCEIGNILGVFLGLSVLSLLCNGFSSFNSLCSQTKISTLFKR